MNSEMIRSAERPSIGRITAVVATYIAFLAAALWLLIGGAQVAQYTIEQGYTLGGQIVALLLTVSDAALLAIVGILALRTATARMPLGQFVLVVATTIFVYFPIEFVMLTGLLQ